MDGQLVPGIPRTLGDAKRLNGKCLKFLIREIQKLNTIGNTMNPLLLAWGSPVNGRVAACKTRIYNDVRLVYQR